MPQPTTAQVSVAAPKPKRSAPYKPSSDLPSYSWRSAAHFSSATSPSNTRQRELFYLTDDRAAETLLGSLRGPLGFDIEWRPQFKKGGVENPVAVVQLADNERILLLHVKHMPRVPRTLKTVLEDESQLKVGVGINRDCDKVRRDLRINLRGIVELSAFARIVDSSKWEEHPGKLISLARLTEIYTGSRLEKSKRVQLADWETYLTPSMQQYAANDAACALSIYNFLFRQRLSLQDPPHPSVYISEISELALAKFNRDASHFSSDASNLKDRDHSSATLGPPTNSQLMPPSHTGRGLLPTTKKPNGELRTDPIPNRSRSSKKKTAKSKQSLPNQQRPFSTPFIPITGPEGSSAPATLNRMSFVLEESVSSSPYLTKKGGVAAFSDSNLHLGTSLRGTDVLAQNSTVADPLRTRGRSKSLDSASGSAGPSNRKSRKLYG